MSPTGISDIEQVRSLFRAQGVDLVYAKRLSPKQDNDKNQIYFGRGMEAISNLIPAKYSLRGKSTSLKKRHSDEDRAVLEGQIAFHWMDRSGATYLAPHTKLIEYFQYPEVRLSGFIKGGRWAPRAIRRTYQGEYGQRIFLFGIREDGSVLAMLLTEHEDPLAASWPSFPRFAGATILETISTAVSDLTKSAVELLVGDLRTITKMGWVRGKRLLKGGSFVDFFANQAGGYTLEALLGVPSNSAKLPDKHGHEIKAYNGGRVSLMTPSPDGGIQSEIGFPAFMKAFGWTGKGTASQVFNGLHRVGKHCSSTDAELVVRGYDAKSNSIPDPSKFEVVLIDRTGQKLASWSLPHLASSWSEKHAAAAYVLYKSRTVVTDDGRKVKELRYGPYAWVAAGTNVLRLIDGISRGLVYFDPAHEISATEAKNRPQWRISASNRAMPIVLEVLYNKVTKVPLE